MPSKLTRRVGASVFVCAKQELTRAMVRDAREHHIPLYVYTLNSTTDVQKMMNLGVQGIISDTADDVVKIVKQESDVNA
jgi:glycerophosphoryl diester phosphodiesterase